MRADVQAIFKSTPIEKQVMMFSATLPKDIRELCRKFMKNPFEVLVDNENKLTLEGLQQYFVDLKESEKNKKLNDILDMLEFNQVIIFVKNINRCRELDKLLREYNFPSICIHGDLEHEDRYCLLFVYFKFFRFLVYFLLIFLFIFVLLIFLQFFRINRYTLFKNFQKRIMVATDIFGRGIDIERVNIVINYDMPDCPDTYLHRVKK